MKAFYAYHNDELVAALIPCINNSNVVGMYDIIRETFYTTTGTAFIAGDFTSSVNKLVNVSQFSDVIRNIIKQETGNGTTTTMSQKAITDYGRRVTAGDLAGTSSIIQSRMEAAGMSINKRTLSGYIYSDTGYCVTPYLPIAFGHQYTIFFKSVPDTRSCGYRLLNSEGVCKANAWYFNATSSVSFTVSNEDYAQLQATFLIQNLNDCYIQDITTDTCIFNGNAFIFSLCDGLLDIDTFGSSLITQELGTGTKTVMSQDATTQIQRNVDAIGRRCFGTTSIFDAYSKAEMCWSRKRYNTSSKPWVDVVCYNASPGNSQRSCWFGFTPNKTTAKPSTMPDYIGFVDNVWSLDFIVRRNGTTIHTTTKALDGFSGSAVAFGCRFDFRRKSVIVAWRSYTGTYTEKTIDLSAYDLDLGHCYMCTTIGYCSYAADLYVGWNNKTNMSDFSAFFSSPLIVGKFKKFAEYNYPSDDIDGSVDAQFTNLMTNWSATQDENGHWVASIDVSTFTRMTHNQPDVSYFLYNNWDLQFWIGKIKATNGSLQIKQNFTTIKDVYDLTDNVFLTTVDGAYTIASGHTVEVRMLGNINGRGYMLYFLGTCTVEMWDWEVHVAMNTNITPENYDGKKIFGGMEFLFDFPNLIVDLPLMGSSNYYAQGFMKYASNKVYARVYDTSTNTYIDKQISNT